ncbi:biofilm regulation phosphoprotein SiaC [Chitinimonas lacunae]|uniref:Biofilm regulation phosphoprotein SiaC n=1 Tax=Chitinimonas lacunae TaxID=1963018 RepID=A0ABV8MLL5_9NEIS
METLSIAATNSSPQVALEPDTGRMRLSGESYPENAFAFYRPIFDWLRRFLREDETGIQLELSLSYLNTGSIKCLMDILDQLDDAHRNGRQVKVTWFYDADNHRALEMAEDFGEDLSLPFDIVPLPESRP